jgi:hypothetical protein
MGLVAVFASAGTLYRRNLGALIAAGVIAAVVTAAITVVVTTVCTLAGLVALHGPLGPAGRLGIVGSAVVAAVLGVLVAQLVVLVLQGGMFKLAISSGRSGRAAEFGELFSGFAQLPSYLVYGLICSLAVPDCYAAAVAITARLLGPLAVILMFPGALVCLWLYVSWLYAVPLIADRRLVPIAALGRSRQMVSRVGWWQTFALLFFFGLALVVIFGLLELVLHASVGGPYLAGLVNIVVMPLGTCYVAAMYLGSEPRQTAPTYASPPGYGPYGGWPTSPVAYDPGTYAPPAEAMCRRSPRERTPRARRPPGRRRPIRWPEGRRRRRARRLPASRIRAGCRAELPGPRPGARECLARSLTEAATVHDPNLTTKPVTSASPPHLAPVPTLDRRSGRSASRR